MSTPLSLRLNFDDISLRDLEDFEDYTGESLDIVDAMAKGDKVSTKVLTGVALLALRQQNPDATIDDARRIRFSDLMDAMAGDDDAAEPDPTPAAAPRRGKGASASRRK